jgi:hypothetical protein
MFILWAHQFLHICCIGAVRYRCDQVSDKSIKFEGTKYNYFHTDFSGHIKINSRRSGTTNGKSSSGKRFSAANLAS